MDTAAWGVRRLLSIWVGGCRKTRICEAFCGISEEIRKCQKIPYIWTIPFRLMQGA
jgi:hypothetical protein